MPFDFNAPKMLWLLNISILSVPYEGHSRNTQWALNLISTFLLEIQLSHVAIYSEMYFQNSKIFKSQSIFGALKSNGINRTDSSLN